MDDYPQMREETLRLLSDLPQSDEMMQRMVNDLYETDPAFERLAEHAARRSSPGMLTLEDAQLMVMPQSPDEAVGFIGYYLSREYMTFDLLKEVQGQLTSAWMNKAKPDITWSSEARVEWGLDVGPVKDVTVNYKVVLEGDFVTYSVGGVE